MTETAIAHTGHDRADESRKTLLTALPGSWPWAVGFLLSMSALGLKFYPALLPIIFIMARSFVNNRYDFLIQLTLFLGGYALITPEITLIHTGWLAFALGIFFMLILRKDKRLRLIIAAWGMYFLLLAFLALTSEESMRIQMRALVAYSTFIYFLVPIALFAGQKFSYDSFVRAIFPYALTLCAFYIIDSYVLCGWVLVPRSHLWDGMTSTFDSLCWMPFSGSFVRKYPPGLYFLTFLILPLARQYRITLWQWAIILLALAATQTFTFVSGLVVVFLLFQGGIKRMMMYALISIAAGTALYFIDGSMAYVDDDYRTVTPIRLYSSVNQILEVTEAVDDEDLAEFGSGRIAQAIPKLELLYNLGYEWRGFGFLDKSVTDNPKFIVENEYYLDQSESIEVATNIEITALQIIVTIGYIGLIAHILFYFYTWWAVRRLRHADYYLSVIISFVWFGLGGFEGLISFMGVITPAVALAVPLLCDKTEQLIALEKKQKDTHV